MDIRVKHSVSGEVAYVDERIVDHPVLGKYLIEAPEGEDASECPECRVFDPADDDNDGLENLTDGE